MEVKKEQLTFEEVIDYFEAFYNELGSLYDETPKWNFFYRAFLLLQMKSLHLFMANLLEENQAKIMDVKNCE